MAKSETAIVLPPRRRSEKWTVMTSLGTVQKGRPAVAPGVLTRLHDGNAEYYLGPDRCGIDCRTLRSGHRASGLPGRTTVSSWVGANRRGRRGSVRKSQLSAGWKGAWVDLFTRRGEQKWLGPRRSSRCRQAIAKRSPVGKMTPAALIRVTQ